MWKFVRFKIECGLFPSLVQEGLAEWHKEYFSKKYDATILETEDRKNITLDPGGMAVMGRDPHVMAIDSECFVSAREEHIMWLVNYFFNVSILDKVAERAGSDDGFIVNIEDEDVISVTMPYSVLFVKKDMYIKICNALGGEYMRGAKSYMDLVNRLAHDGIAHQGIKHCIASLEEGEA